MTYTILQLVMYVWMPNIRIISKFCTRTSVFVKISTPSTPQQTFWWLYNNSFNITFQLRLSLYSCNSSKEINVRVLRVI